MVKPKVLAEHETQDIAAAPKRSAFDDAMKTEPTGPSWIERGDQIAVREGTTTGTVIGVSYGPTRHTQLQRYGFGVHDYAEIVMDKPKGFTATFPMRKLVITIKVVH